jgi:hypothetical protein
MGLFHRKSAFERRCEERQRAEGQRAWEQLKKVWDEENEEYERQARQATAGQSSPKPAGIHASFDADVDY